MQNNKLIAELTNKTQDLKNEYFEKIEAWAESFHALCVERLRWNEVKWCEYFGLTPEIKNAGTGMEFQGMPKGFYNTKNARRQEAIQSEARRIAKITPVQYIAKELKMAEQHYNYSIAKLAFRVEKKGLNIDFIEIVSGRVGVNIETMITDGILTVRAFTIIAQGEIQRPHYRYLIK
jgi:hypothetical protein